MAGPKSRLELTIFVQKRCSVYTSESEIAEENSRTTSFGENGFSCLATANKHLLSRSDAKQ